MVAISPPPYLSNNLFLNVIDIKKVTCCYLTVLAYIEAASFFLFNI